MQLQCAHIEAKFYGEIHELERKYAALYQPLFDKVTTRPPTSDLSFSLAPPGPLLSAADCILNHWIESSVNTESMGGQSHVD